MRICCRGDRIGDIELKGGALDFWKIGEVGLPADPTPFVSFAQKILTVNLPKKKTFVFCA
jgi:hypothetical protein